MENVLLGEVQSYPHAPPHPPVPNVHVTGTAPVLHPDPTDVTTGACGAESTQQLGEFTAPQAPTGLAHATAQLFWAPQLHV